MSLLKAMDDILSENKNKPVRYFLMHPITKKKIDQELLNLFSSSFVCTSFGGVAILTVNEFPIDRIELI